WRAQRAFRHDEPALHQIEELVVGHELDRLRLLQEEFGVVAPGGLLALRLLGQRQRSGRFAAEAVRLVEQRADGPHVLGEEGLEGHDADHASFPLRVDLVDFVVAALVRDAAFAVAFGSAFAFALVSAFAALVFGSTFPLGALAFSVFALASVVSALAFVFDFAGALALVSLALALALAARSDRAFVFRSAFAWASGSSSAASSSS